MPEPEYLTCSDVARLANVSRSMVVWWNDHQRLPALRTVNGTRIFRRVDVERFLEERRED